jgi:hypothetical protein
LAFTIYQRCWNVLWGIRIGGAERGIPPTFRGREKTAPSD